VSTSTRELAVSNETFSKVFLAHYRSKSVEECVFKVARGCKWVLNLICDVMRKFRSVDA
jgi:hypothetical protein